LPRSVINLGACWGSRAANRVVRVEVGVVERGDDLLQRALLFQALGQPDVVVAHLGSGVGAKRLATMLDQLSEPPELLGVLVHVGLFGRELVAGQAGVAALTRLTWGQQAQDVGQHPVGTLVELKQVIQVAWVEFELVAVLSRRNSRSWVFCSVWA
jgi:hypothetical protein